MRPIDDLLIKILRNDFIVSDDVRIACEIISTEDWHELFRLANRNKILPQLHKAIKDYLPKTIESIIAKSIDEHRARCEESIHSLERIACYSAREKIRFVVFKGIASSLSIYGNMYSRQARDIDILIATEDISRFDYVLKSAGFFQPDIAIGGRAKDRGVARFLQFHSKTSIPYPKRRRSNSDQLVPYYDRETSCRIEVHDGYCQLPQSFTTHMLWGSRIIKVQDFNIRIPSIDDVFFLTLATAYGNSFDYFSMVDGDMNLRDYVDLHHLIKTYQSRQPIDSLFALAKERGMNKMINDVSDAYSQIYGRDQDAFISSERCGTIHQHLNRDFLAEICDPALCSRNAVSRLRTHTKSKINSESNQCICKIEFGQWYEHRNRPDIDIKFCITPNENGISVQWMIPLNLECDLHLFAFRISFISLSKAPYLELSINCRVNESGIVSSFFCRNNRLTPRFVPEMSDGELNSSLFQGKGNAIVSVEAPLSIESYFIGEHFSCTAVIPSVYIRDSPSTFYDINYYKEYSDIRYYIDQM